MTSHAVEITPRGYARTAGLGYLIIILAGISAEFFVRSQLIVPGDAAATTANIANAPSLFRAGIGLDLVMLLCDVLLAGALYMFLKPVSKGVALIAAFFRLVHAAVYGANLLNLFAVLFVASGTGAAASMSTAQSQMLTMLFLNGHAIGYTIGLVFFGVHCLLLGYLLVKADFVPTLLGILILIAGVGYLVDSFAQVLLTNYVDYQTILMLVVFIPALIGELSLSVWLVAKGGKGNA